MNYLRPHVPSFVDVDRPDGLPFTDTTALLGLEVVQRFKGPTFSHFCMSDELLMVVNTDGPYWVIGYIADPTAIDLPQWVAPPTVPS